MEVTVQKYIGRFKICHRLRVPHFVGHGTNMPLPPPYSLWEEVRMDFVTNLPERTVSVYTVMLAIYLTS